MSLHEELVDFTSQFRADMMKVWSDNTAHPWYRPLPEGMPISYGQCGITSLLFLLRVRRDFPGHNFRIVDGTVNAVKDGQLVTVIPHHAWAEHVEETDEGPIITVMDVTADQALYGAPLTDTVVATREELRRANVSYVPDVFTTSAEECKIGASKYPGQYLDRLDRLHQAYDLHILGREVGGPGNLLRV